MIKPTSKPSPLRKYPGSLTEKFRKVGTVQNTVVYLDKHCRFRAWPNGEGRPGISSTSYAEITRKIQEEFRAAVLGHDLRGIYVIWRGSENYDGEFCWRAGVIVDRATEPTKGRGDFRIRVKFPGFKEPKWVPERDLHLGGARAAKELNELDAKVKSAQMHYAKAKSHFPIMSHAKAKELAKARARQK